MKAMVRWIVLMASVSVQSTKGLGRDLKQTTVVVLVCDE